MRHLHDHRKLGRTSPHRQALLRNLAMSLVRHGRIETTLPKAKELRRVADRLVTWAKHGNIAGRRLARRWLNDRELLSKLFDELAVRFQDRAGGYTRIFRLGSRMGDGAPMALIEYLPGLVAEKKSAPTPKEEKKITAKPAAKSKAATAPKAKKTAKAPAKSKKKA